MMSRRHRPAAIRKPQPATRTCAATALISGRCVTTKVSSRRTTIPAIARAPATRLNSGEASDFRSLSHGTGTGSCAKNWMHTQARTNMEAAFPHTREDGPAPRKAKPEEAATRTAEACSWDACARRSHSADARECMHASSTPFSASASSSTQYAPSACGAADAAHVGPYRTKIPLVARGGPNHAAVQPMEPWRASSGARSWKGAASGGSLPKAE
mmetsp:Transcript_33666/g.81481  ORF Transcript_33666/g.81481 Transcript_33666/m.81481 type:complete len:214 (+) Transcript_33666:101-742(+)